MNTWKHNYVQTNYFTPLSVFSHQHQLMVFHSSSSDSKTSSGLFSQVELSVLLVLLFPFCPNPFLRSFSILSFLLLSISYLRLQSNFPCRFWFSVCVFRGTPIFSKTAFGPALFRLIPWCCSLKYMLIRSSEINRITWNHVTGLFVSSQRSWYLQKIKLSSWYDCSNRRILYWEVHLK